MKNKKKEKKYHHHQHTLTHPTYSIYLKYVQCDLSAWHVNMWIGGCLRSELRTIQIYISIVFLLPVAVSESWFDVMMRSAPPPPDGDAFKSAYEWIYIWENVRKRLNVRGDDSPQLVNFRAGNCVVIRKPSWEPYAVDVGLSVLRCFGTPEWSWSICVVILLVLDN